jgi:oxygen-independent coproporphyrinogen III oxidase
MAGIYLHIPFCRQACHYCDFHFSTNLTERANICAALEKELLIQHDYLAHEEVHTIYFGGGTPSLLSPGELDSILIAISSHFSVSPSAEITLEGNPDDLSREKLAALFAIGVNRLSIGIQSFDSEILKFLNRAHSSKQAIQCVEDARSVGFKNLSIDLIYAIPGQSMEQWKSNIDQALALKPEHLSSYALTIEEKTAFGNWQKKGILKAVPEENAADEFAVLMKKLEEAGYEHYEISNFSKPDFYSKHNSNYWRGENYLGIGPSAHSYNGVSRQFNVSNNHAYLKAILEHKTPFELEILTREDKINEYIFTSLRTSWGCDLSFLKSHLHYDLIAAQASYLKNLEDRKLIKLEGNNLRLTTKGKFVADQIASDLFTTV